jgi:hypothetical protein
MSPTTIPDLPVEWGAVAEPLTAIRQAVRAKLLANSTISAIVGDRIYYLIREAEPGFSCIVYADTGAQEYLCQAPTAPILTDRIFTFNLYTLLPREGSALLHAVRRALHQGPVTVPEENARVAYITYLDDGADPAQEGEPARVIIRFRVKAYLTI